MSNFLTPILCIALFLLLKGKPTKANFTWWKESERQALLNFKQNLGTLNPIVQTWGLDSNRDCCTWSGVECSNRNGHVIKLDVKLSYVVGAGTINPSLLKLHHLSYLDLSSNDFSGIPIPKFVGSFKKLRYLGLSNTGFSGPIPSELGNLSWLETLRFSNLTLVYNVGNLEWLSRLSSLKVLDLSFTNLGEASDWSQVVNRLPLIQTLDLSGCSLPSTIPSSFSLINSSSSLSTLILQANSLTSSAIYPWLFNVSNNLVNLDLSFNRLKGPIPKAFGNMVAMRSLVLSHNELEDKIPISFGNMCNLSTLDLESNYLSGEVFEFVQNTSRCTANSLEKLRLAKNQLTGSVSNEIAKLSSLEELDLGDNCLNGTISESIGQLFNLNYLWLPGNSFQNVVISEIHFSNLFNLQVLDLAYSSLTLKFNSGWIPPFQLGAIYLASCKLGPRFPKWLSSQNSLLTLDISAAEISDSFPTWLLKSHTFIFYLNLSFNQISGNFQSWNIGTTILLLDLSSNNLTGPYPDLKISVLLNLSKNKFSGSIFSICNDSRSEHLEFLDLSNNLFSGMVPDCLAQLNKLKVLNLADNNFSGPMPSSFPFILEALNLRGNRFSGEITSSLKNCIELKFLDLSDNKLRGNFPIWIGKSLSSLVFLSLRANQFDGGIPQQLCELNHIQILDLSLNKILGTIPPCFSNFTSMAQKVKLSTTIEQMLTIWDYVKFAPIESDIIFVNSALLMWKGVRQKYNKILGLLLVIDLSGNKLFGEIPEELTRLQELVVLNLSRNFLTGQIPEKIGQLRQLQSLDLSRNKFSGSIPSSLSEITFLATLDLSYNYLSGKIPTGPQLQLFDASMFSHNHGLCGPPVTPNCSGSAEPPQGQPGRDQDDFDEFRKWFYAGMGLGFAVGFWGFCGAVLFRRSWRHSYFRFLDNMKDWLYVSFVLLKARLERRIQA